MSISILVAAASVLLANPAASYVSAPSVVQKSDSWVEQARSACRNGDFSTLFEAFVHSSQVRHLYSAPRIEQLTRGTPGVPLSSRPEGPDDFQIGAVDYTYGDAASIRRWEADETQPFVRLNVEIHELSDGSVRVDFQPGEFIDDEEGDGATFVRATGEPAAYVFAKVNQCWRLTQHLR